MRLLAIISVQPDWLADWRLLDAVSDRCHDYSSCSRRHHDTLPERCCGTFSMWSPCHITSFTRCFVLTFHCKLAVRVFLYNVIQTLHLWMLGMRFKHILWRRYVIASFKFVLWVFDNNDDSRYIPPSRSTFFHSKPFCLTWCIVKKPHKVARPSLFQSAPSNVVTTAVSTNYIAFCCGPFCLFVFFVRRFCLDVGCHVAA